MSSREALQAELVTALGMLVVHFAALEESLHDAILLLCDTENQSVSVLTAGLNCRTLVDKFGALCKELGTARVPLPEVEEFCKYLNALGDQRNAFVHSAWDVGGTREQPRRIKRSAKPGTGFKLTVKPTTPADIRELAENVRVAEHKLWEIVP
jgi:hypothetical protein